MANELKVKNGLIVQGQITASSNILAPFAFTTASAAVTASYALTASVVLGSITSASYASTASWALNVSASGIVGTPLVSLSASFASSSISASNATSASYAFSSSYAVTSSAAINAVTSSNLVGWNFNNTGSILQSINTQSIVIALSTGSYLAAFFDYAAVSASNIRAGTVFGSWVNGSITYSEVSNVDVGDTSQVTMSMGLSASIVQLSASVSNTTPWTIKALGRYI